MSEEALIKSGYYYTTVLLVPVPCTALPQRWQLGTDRGGTGAAHRIERRWTCRLPCLVLTRPSRLYFVYLPACHPYMTFYHQVGCQLGASRLHPCCWNLLAMHSTLASHNRSGEYRSTCQTHAMTLGVQ